MSGARTWREVKAEAHERHPEMVEDGAREQARTELAAFVAGYHLKELRRALGKTQSEVAEVLGVTQARISQIENGDLDSMELETLRSYAAALGGHVDVTVHVGAHSVRVA